MHPFASHSTRVRSLDLLAGLGSFHTRKRRTRGKWLTSIRRPARSPGNSRGWSLAIRFLRLPAARSSDGISEACADRPIEVQEAPGFFPDLNLDQIVDTITAGREQYDLKSFFYAPLASVETVDYRQDVFRDLLENPRLLELVCSFAESLRSMRAQLAISESGRYPTRRERGHQLCQRFGKQTRIARVLASNTLLRRIQSCLERYALFYRFA